MNKKYSRVGLIVSFTTVNISQMIVSEDQCWVSYSKNVIYYSLLVTLFKSNIVTYYFLATLFSYITVSSRRTEDVTVYLPHKCY